MQKKALVFGLGKSGLAASKYLHKIGFSVFGFDDKKVEDLPEYISFVNSLEKEFLESITVAIYSPGIPKENPNFQTILKYCKIVEGEAEFGLQRIAPYAKEIIGITGTKGKTTLTSFISHVLNGKALGNVGFPFTEYLCLEEKKEPIAAELSSFQIESLKTKSLDQGVITNISPDHLDRYKDCKEYAFVKVQMASFIKEGGKLFLPKDLFIEFASFLQNLPLQFFFVEKVLDDFSKSALFTKIKKECSEKLLGMEMLALARALTQDVSDADFLSAIHTFEKPLHRMEFVTTISGVAFINDSKATNIESVFYGVRQVGKPKHLIMGGSDKGLDFSGLSDLTKENVKKVYAIGECAKKIQIALQEKIPVGLYSSLEEAVYAAFFSAKPNESVMLSPACASYDQFKSYAHRGDTFKQIVEELQKKEINR